MKLKNMPSSIFWVLGLWYMLLLLVIFLSTVQKLEMRSILFITDLATVLCNLHRPPVCLQQLHAPSAHQDTLISVLILLPVTKSKISHLVPPCEHQLPLQDLKCNWERDTNISLESLTHCRMWIRKWFSSKASSSIPGLPETASPPSTFNIQVIVGTPQPFYTTSTPTHRLFIWPLCLATYQSHFVIETRTSHRIAMAGMIIQKSFTYIFANF